MVNSNKVIIDAANKIRKLYHSSIGGVHTPSIDVFILCEKVLNIDVFPLQDLRNIAETDAFIDNSLDIIYVDEKNISKPRMNFSIAHEIGHKILHANEIVEARNNSSVHEWKQNFLNIDYNTWGTLEREANTFAGHLLVPKNLLIEEIKQHKTQIEYAKKLGIVEESIFEYLLTPIAKKFCVNSHVISIRINVEKIKIFDIIKKP